MTATITRLGSTVDAIDLFCGFGGSSQGIHKAGAKLRLAANHNPLAIDCHAANYPDVDHARADLSDKDAADYVDPADLPPARFLWASPSCKHHSKANAQKLYAHGPAAELSADDQEAYANSERSRVTMLCPIRYAAKHRPEIVVIENVVEAAQWGPSRTGKKAGDGSTFRWWLNEWVKLGYEYECLFLNSMFFPPCPQSRDRMYVVFWRRGNSRPNLNFTPMAICGSETCSQSGKIVLAEQTWKKRTAAWPLERWGKYGTQYTYNCPSCKTRVEPVRQGAYTAIDWTRLGPTIGERAELGMQPLEPTTLQRVARGLAKFRHGPPVRISGRGADRMFTHSPFLTEMRSGGSIKAGQYTVDRYAHGVTAGGFHHGLACPPSMFAKQNGGPADTAWHSTKDPFNTITSRDTTALVVMPWVEQYKSAPVALTDNLATVTSHNLQAYAAAEDWTDITSDQIDRVHYRMLDPDPELRRIMAFADDYILLGNKTEMCAGLGNAVTPTVATWVTEQTLASLNSHFAIAA